ncbi:hypothetical protein BLNAU_10958 [Blattamonas nauphoetae]|uniref:Uncharacterized protein n=1 Tax=Blattamonas nauphoetae TaxID=2049346 RepID=A0ABQ9XNZ0_9EUKA|nr:hypothetical protein BLNAU_10958 [Blattamonas nauphoetae]
MKIHESHSPHLTACVRRGRRSSVSLFIPLDDDTPPTHPLSPHSSANPTTATIEGRTRLLLTDLREAAHSTREMRRESEHRRSRPRFN